MLIVFGSLLAIVGIVLLLLQPATGLGVIGLGLFMLAFGVDLKAIRDRLPEPPKTPKQLQREAEHEARLQKSAQMTEEAKAVKENTGT